MENREIYKAALGMIDLTSLSSTDTYAKIREMTLKVGRFHESFPDMLDDPGVVFETSFGGEVLGCLEGGGGGQDADHSCPRT